jgi:VanZ family protein
MRRLFFHLPEPEHKVYSWSFVLIWAAIIFMTIPFARKIQGFFEHVLGSRAYMAAAGILGVFLVLVVLTYMFRRRKRQVALRLGWLAVLMVASVWVMRNQLQTPAEAIHFFEYGILSFLLFRAWSHHVRDRLIYVIASMTLIIIASCDEFLQWLTPGRFWDFRDIRLNVLAGLFIQAMIALVINPSGIYEAVQRRSVRLLCVVTWITLLIMGVAISNTPARVDLYATRIPFMRFLSNNESVMSEYGYRNRDPEIGTFYSRFTMPELQKIDRERGAQVGEILRRYRSLVDYREFLQLFTSSVDPFLHEMRIHLYRRDHYYDTAWQYYDRDRERFINQMTVAFRENQLLEKYYPTVMSMCECAMSGKAIEELKVYADLNHDYTSPVSDHLVTLATELELWIILLTACIIVGVMYARYGREPRLRVP